MSPTFTAARLRAHARMSTLFPPTTLPGAIARLGFVQADPIRAPARAQDLILRHRVAGYRAGDLERSYRRLRLEEDFLYAYGFMPGQTRDLLHPRLNAAGEAQTQPLSGLAAELLAYVRAHGPIHPADLERFGAGRTTNAWGGLSKATTHALDRLRHDGLLRVAGRRAGIRMYEAAAPSLQVATPFERGRQLALRIVQILAPVSLVSLRGAWSLMARHNPGLGPLPSVIAAALHTGELERAELDGETYLWPALEPGWQPLQPPAIVRLLAPFDPLVWDRRRFKHLWGWDYRFEAYTPPARRRFGYYAMPLLWGDAVIGWANITMAAGAMQATMGYARDRPSGGVFRRALDAELARMERFLRLEPPATAAPPPPGSATGTRARLKPGRPRIPAQPSPAGHQS